MLTRDTPVLLSPLPLPPAAQPVATVCGPQRAVSYVRFLGGSHLVSASTDSALRLWDLRQVMASSDATTTSAASSGTRCLPACTYTGHRNQRNFVGLSVSPDGHILCGSEDNSGKEVGGWVGGWVTDLLQTHKRGAARKGNSSGWQQRCRSRGAGWSCLLGSHLCPALPCRVSSPFHRPSSPPPPSPPAVYSYYRTLPFSTARYRFASGEAGEGHQPFVSAVCWANRSRHCLAANSQGLLQILKLE